MRPRRVWVGLVTLAALGCAGPSSQGPEAVAPARTTAPAESVRPAPAAPVEPPPLAAELTRVVGELDELQNVVAKLAATSRQQEEQLAQLQRRLSELESAARSSRAAVPGGFAPPGPVAPSPPTVASTGTTTADDLYRTGVEKIRAKEWDAAILVLYDLITNHADHPLREEAQFLVAEIFYAQADYRSALAELEALLAALPQGSKVPDTLVKIGLCQRALGDGERARRAWERVVREFPNSGAAHQARLLLRG